MALDLQTNFKFMEGEVVKMFGIWQASVCLFAFLGLMSIWHHIGRKKQDTGQVWLALSILCWSLSGFIDATSTHLGLGLLTHQVIRSVLSLLNSLFILLALPWFKYLPEFLESIIKSKYWTIIVGLPFVFSIIPTVSKMSSGGLISELDFYYSTLTLIILGMVLWTSFSHRKLKALAILSVVCILITFAAQLYKLTSDFQGQILISAIFKTSLIMIFFALALSWVKDFTQKLELEAGDLFLTFTGIRGEDGKHLLLKIKGIVSVKDVDVELSNKYYSLLEKFAEAKKTGDGWLEIKPKLSQTKRRLYDINDHNEIKRLLTHMLDQIFGKNLWNKEDHYTPLKETLFEMSTQRERKIRLGIPPSNIVFGEKI